MEQELVIFDVDETLIRGQSQKHLLTFLRKKKLIGLRFFIKLYFWFILYKLGLITDPKPVMEYAFNLFKGRTESEINAIVGVLFEEVLKKEIYQEAQELISMHQKQGREVFLISNSIEPIIKRVADHLHIRYYLATEIEVEQNVFTGKIKGTILYGSNKVTAFNKFIEKNNLKGTVMWAYSDHASDIPLLSIAEHPVATNPEKKLLAYAQKMHWDILTFTH